MDRPVSPTNTEWNTFQVIANPNQVNIATTKPTRNDFLKSVPEDSEESDSESEEILVKPVAQIPMPPLDRRSQSSSSSGSSSTTSSRRSSHSSVPLPKSPKQLDRDSLFDSISVAHGQANPIQNTNPQNNFQAPVMPPPPEATGFLKRQPEESVHDDDSHEAYQSNYSPNYGCSDPPEVRAKVVYSESPSRQRALEMTEQEIWVEKEGLLSEISIMERKGFLKLTKPLTMDDSLEEIQFQQDRANSVQNAVEMVEYGKSGIQLTSRMMEFAFKSMGLKLMDGFSNQFKDMKRYDRPLTKMYRKQWRGQYFTPETELAILVLGAVFMTVLNNNGLGMMGSLMSNMFAPGSSAPEKPAAEVPPLARPVPVQASGNVPFAKPEVKPTTPAPRVPEPSYAQANVPSMPVMKRPNSAAPPPVPAGPPRPIPMGSVGAEVAEAMPKMKTVQVGSTTSPARRGPSKKNAEPPLQL